MEITAIFYLIPALVMFACGVYGFITRKNMIAMLISLELMLNAVDVNFVVFNRFLYPGSLEGMFFTHFAIAIAGDACRHCGGIEGFGDYRTVESQPAAGL